MNPRSRFLLAGVTLAIAAATAGCCTPALVQSTIRPSGPFDPATAATPPDYAHDEAWIALPGTKSAATTAIDALPAIAEDAAPVDVFFVHSTSSIKATWTNPWDDAEIRTASIRGGTLIQASVFNNVARIYAPAYRQSTGLAYIEPTADGQRAIDIAYSDVARAFESFLQRIGPSRPFIIAAHSQGSGLATRLVRERIAPNAVRGRMVAAYLIGMALHVDDLGGVKPCAAPADTGCVVSFNARGTAYEPNTFEFTFSHPTSERICVNPTFGSATSSLAPSDLHRGAMFLDSAAPTLVPRFLESRCRNGFLVVDKMQPVPDRGLASGILLSVMGGQNFHSIEYQLFYGDLRHDAQRRVAAFFAAAAQPADEPTTTHK